jgi:hypothetical protein
MADFDSELPIRSQLPGQVNPDDVIVKIGDATNPTTQQASVDTFGSLQSRIADASGNVITSTLNAGKQSLDVNVTSTIAVGQVDESAFTYGVTSETPVGGVYNDVGASMGAAGETGAVRITQFRAFHVNLRDAAGNQLGDSNADGLWVRPGDGTNSQSYTATGEAKVKVTSLLAEDHNYGTVGANTLRTAAQIGNATGAADFNFGTIGAQSLRTAAQIGNATGAADFGAGSATAQTLRVTASNFPTTVDTNYGTVGANTIRTASQIGNATGAADFNAGATGAQTLRVTANQGAPNTAANAWTVAITSGGAANSPSNPIFVSEDTTPGTSVNDFKDAVAVVAAGTDNHDYTVTAGKTFYFNQAESSASGKAKMSVAIETGVGTGIFNTKFVQFNSTADTNMSVHLADAITVAAGVRVRLIMVNRDNQAEDLYSTISGFEI